MLGPRVLHMVDVDAPVSAVTRLIEAFDPRPGVIDVGGLLRDYEDRVELIDGHEPQYSLAGQLPAARREDGIEVLDHLVRDAVLQGKQPERHSREPVDVEDLHGLEE